MVSNGSGFNATDNYVFSSTYLAEDDIIIFASAEDVVVPKAFMITNGILVSLLLLIAICAFCAYGEVGEDQFRDKHWLFWPQCVPGFASSIAFYFYLSQASDGSDHTFSEFLLVSSLQFPWIFCSIYSMFIASNDDLRASVGIYKMHDLQIIVERRLELEAMPQHIYLVSGIFHLTFSRTLKIWTDSEFETFPSLHEDILDVIADFVGDDIYEIPSKLQWNWVNSSHRQWKREEAAKELTTYSGILFGINFILCFLSWIGTGFVRGFMIFVMIQIIAFGVFHWSFTTQTFKVLQDNKSLDMEKLDELDIRLKDGEKRLEWLLFSGPKYRWSLLLSWIVVGLELLIAILFCIEGEVHDGSSEINGLIIAHSVVLILLYIPWSCCGYV